MAIPWAAISAGSSVLGGLFGRSGAKEAARRARELGRLNSRFIIDESREQSRRLRYEFERTKGSARATIAGSGFRSGRDSMGSSHKAYLAELTDVQNKELAWLDRSAQSRSKIARMGGESQAASLESQGNAMLLRGLSSAAATIHAWKG